LSLGRLLDVRYTFIRQSFSKGLSSNLTSF